jgi:hypothetical protein
MPWNHDLGWFESYPLGKRNWGDISRWIILDNSRNVENSELGKLNILMREKNRTIARAREGKKIVMFSLICRL